MNQYILIWNDYLMTHFLKSKYLVENYLTEHVSSLIFCHRQHSCHTSTHNKLLKPTFISIKTNINDTGLTWVTQTGKMQYEEDQYNLKLVQHIQNGGHPDQKHGHPVQELGHP